MMLPFQPWYRPIASDWKDNDEDLSVSSPAPTGPGVVSIPTMSIVGGGEFANGVTIQAVSGVYTNYDTIVNEWYINNVVVPGETGLTFLVSGLVDGDTLFFAQRVTNAVAEILVDVGFEAILTAHKPVNTALPLILQPGDGSPQLGENLTATSGTWTTYGGTQTGRHWLRDNVDTGITTSTYTLTTPDQDEPIEVEITYTNSFGSTTVSSLPFTPQMNPFLAITPVVGAYVIGQQPTLTTSAVWYLADTVTGIWQKGGVDQGGQTTNTYTAALTVGDVIRFHTTGDNAYSAVLSGYSNAITVTATAAIQQNASVLYIPSAHMGDSQQYPITQSAGVAWILTSVLGEPINQAIAQSADIVWIPSGNITP
jgi:hypothetical protein